jgi:hypothetical protein
MRALFTTVLAVLLSTACGHLHEGQALFREGRYAEARQQWLRLEREYEALDHHERARYALYRGLTELALGHAYSADRWLTRAKRFADTDREAYAPDEHGKLLVARRSMGHMPGE